MSDSVSSAKVEDVLASIRRLVSEDRRPFDAAGPANGEPMPPRAGTDARVQGDRLILTPSLRVSGPEVSTAVLRLDETVRLPGSPAPGQEHEQSDAEPGAAGDVTADAGGRTHGGARSEVDAGQGDAPAPLPARDPDGEREPADMRGDEEGRDAGAEVSADPLLLEPDDRSDGTAARSEPTSDGSSAGPVDSGTPAHPLGDAELRELVCDVVRQELRGELGERITRNVRKLVRREIQRALAMKDLE